MRGRQQATVQDPAGEGDRLLGRQQGVVGGVDLGGWEVAGVVPQPAGAAGSEAGRVPVLEALRPGAGAGVDGGCPEPEGPGGLDLGATFHTRILSRDRQPRPGALASGGLGPSDRVAPGASGSEPPMGA